MTSKGDEAKILNAIRMGVIPDTDLSDLMIGREAEITSFMELFKSMDEFGLSNVKFIQGAYGAGKTFLVNYLVQKALSENFVVVPLSINSGFYLTKLDQLYTEAMNHLKIGREGSGKGTNFEEIFDLWLRNLKKEKGFIGATGEIHEVIETLNEYNSAFALVLLTYIRARVNLNEELSTIAASWIKGDRNISYELKKQLKVKGSVDSENAMSILRGFVHLIHLIGYKGIVIMIDEAELLMNIRVDLRQKAYENIRYLIDLCGSNELERCLFVFCGTDEFFMDEEKGIRSYEALFQRIGLNIKDHRQESMNYSQPIIQLKRFHKEEWLRLMSVFMKLHSEYNQYAIEVEAETIYALVMLECTKLYGSNQVSIRNFLKKLIEVLDLYHKSPGLPIFNTKISVGKQGGKNE